MILKAKWVLPVNKKPIEDGAIVVSGDRIEAVGKRKKLEKNYPDEKIKDFGQAVLMPGFIDAHTHFEYSAFRGLCDDLPFTRWKLQVTEKSECLTAEDWFFSAELGALEAIGSGITCIADITDTGASLQASKEAGLRGIIFNEVMGMDNSKVNQIISDAKKRVSSWQAETKGTNLEIGISPYSVYTVSPSLFKAVSHWAKEDGLTVCFHLAGSSDEYEFVKYGASPLATSFLKQMGWNDLLWQPMGVSPVKYVEQWDAFESGKVIVVHCIQVSDADIDILKKYDVSIVHCPKCSAKLGMGIAPLDKLFHQNFKVGIGMDSPASNNTIDMFDEMRMGLLLQRGLNKKVEGLSAEKFVKMATLGGAQALRIDSQVGSLEKGKKADLIAVDISHAHQSPVRDPYSTLVYTANQEDVVFTMVGGKVLYEGGEHLTLDKEKILAMIEPVRMKLKG
ncbi:amidohydrolase family protein [Candidatus Oleimmundimicrobium sp.]|uniref:amidohydrolase family protein n=1 Tax=Candidatus Oleimmundimicrobium sp. TaxID=3060597 RepID=UPI00271801E2|nr:amidohydrolase family protein [Candidatus Oleimmundimicrobium sp.]MDO8886618.1 amidohydrolase family protein [Candidatus Oleimmundimicrobium sp.]